MDAIILTAAQVTALKAANAVGKATNRAIEPRQLDDGTWIVNADVLNDPALMTPPSPWQGILRQAQNNRAAKSLEELATIDDATKLAKGL